MIDASLKRFATVAQARYIDAVNETGGFRKAAKKLGIGLSAVSGGISAVKKKAAMRGVSPEHGMTHEAPDPFLVKGVSTLYDESGNIRAQWVKTRLEEDTAYRIALEAFESASVDLPRAKLTRPPKHVISSLCNLYTMTDCHMGMLAWHKEGGADWDLKIAENVLTGCFTQMVSSSPSADTCIIAQLGDWLHSDGLVPVTPTAKNVLDQDGRFSKIVAASVRVLRRLVDVALQKHSNVIVLMAEGNHDPASSIWLRVMFRALYENEPRVKVIDSELPYYVHQHGETMLGFHHGHLKKTDKLPLLFAAQFPAIWGETKKRYVHTGHWHHVEEQEHPGMKVIQHPTLAAKDAYAARGGWLSEREATAITYHNKFGQVGRVTVTPEMLGA